jgi:Predicted transcriptional regulators
LTFKKTSSSAEQEVFSFTLLPNFLLAYILSYISNEALNEKGGALMNFDFNDSTPLYQQIADQLEEMIFSGGFDEGSQVPSTTQLSQQLHINPATVLKGMNILVNKDLLEKRRGLGMFVKKGAQQKIMEQRKESFYNDYVKSLLVEAGKLGITKQHLLDLIERGENDGSINS